MACLQEHWAERKEGLVAVVMAAVRMGGEEVALEEEMAAVGPVGRTELVAMAGEVVAMVPATMASVTAVALVAALREGAAPGASLVAKVAEERAAAEGWAMVEKVDKTARTVG